MVGGLQLAVFIEIPGAGGRARGSVKGEGREWGREEPGRPASSLTGPPPPSRTPLPVFCGAASEVVWGEVDPGAQVLGPQLACSRVVET